jgi:hypothetical protein
MSLIMACEVLLISSCSWATQPHVRHPSGGRQQPLARLTLTIENLFGLMLYINTPAVACMWPDQNSQHVVMAHVPLVITRRCRFCLTSLQACLIPQDVFVLHLAATESLQKRVQHASKFGPGSIATACPQQALLGSSCIAQKTLRRSNSHAARCTLPLCCCIVQPLPPTPCSPE